MSIFNVIQLFGGLAMFLYGMRLMGDGLKEGSTGTLKKAMEAVTNNAVKAFLLGALVTAVIQSSTATIVITSGLVGAGIISLHQSLGIIIGANVGTTVTGQIIRLLDIDAGGNSVLRFFQPSTLAPLALIIGIIFIMFLKVKNARTIGTIAMGFGILFTGLMNMTGAVKILSDSGVFNPYFEQLGKSPLLGYLTGFVIAFILQSSSATVGILQAFAMAGGLTFKVIYPVILGIYLGDCLTTAMVCSIGAKPEAKRVGAVNVMYNLGETVTVFLAVFLLRRFGLLGAVWEAPINSGGIANTNTIFNLGCSFVLMPFIGYAEKLSRKLIKDEPEKENPYADLFEGLNPVFFTSPAIAFRGCYNMLSKMFDLSRTNIFKALDLIRHYEPEKYDEIMADEEYIDSMTDSVSKYLLALSPNIKKEDQVRIMDQYYKVVTEFERLGDHATNIAETAQEMQKENTVFSEAANHELEVTRELIDRILGHTELAFKKRDVEEAARIEPLEEVVDDLVNALHDHHLQRLKDGKCTVEAESSFLNLLNDIERISDVCSNVGVATVARVHPELAEQAHDYISSLHQGSDTEFTRRYREAHEIVFSKLDGVN